MRAKCTLDVKDSIGYLIQFAGGSTWLRIDRGFTPRTTGVYFETVCTEGIEPMLLTKKQARKVAKRILKWTEE